MASVPEKPYVLLNQNMYSADHNRNLDIDPENIPYHARENALPFKYGDIPAGFSACNLNHVEVNAGQETVERKASPSSPSTPILISRRTHRPSISSSIPLLRKTPSREEFEDMLIERIGNSDEAKRRLTPKLAHKQIFPNDLDECDKSSRILDVEQRMQAHPTVILDEKRAPNFNLQLVEPKRPETPAFPVVPKTINSERCVSPYTAPNMPISEDNCTLPIAEELQQSDCISHTKEVEPHLVKFAKNSSDLWYKPNMSRDEAVELLRNAEPGTFLIRNSTTYRDAFGLVLRVAKPPAGVFTAPGYGDQLVRHFLIEPTTKGVHLMGCKNEPIFTSLSAFVFEHSIHQMALPCTLILPDLDHSTDNQQSRQEQTVVPSAACNVLYLYQTDVESLTGDEAVRRAVHEMYSNTKLPVPLEVQFKVSQQGITLTDNTRTQFLRRHYPAKNVSHFCIDPDNHFWSVLATDEDLQRSVNKSIFAFIARPLAGSKDNQCHIFCDLSSSQPASAIVAFAHRVLPLHDNGFKVL
ncbi:hypothetical protein KR222_002952 [Zaprionus bogoriensis]|nr:hypothetical protein KR222_002952 [Zaprionus bogoriensis]